MYIVQIFRPNLEYYMHGKFPSVFKINMEIASINIL